MTYRLIVTFALTEKFSQDTDDLIKLVGDEPSGSGAGFGERDVEFDFPTREARQDAAMKISQKHPEYRVRFFGLEAKA
jgi:hypothetical protein